MYAYIINTSIIIVQSADTTDIQSVNVVIISADSNNDECSDITIHCKFISNTDARGCQVSLIHDKDNNALVVNLTRDVNTITAYGEIRQFQGNVIAVYGYDIESDGNIGSLSLLGVIEHSVPSKGMLSFTSSHCKVFKH